MTRMQRTKGGYSDDQIGGCGVNVARDFCPCEGYELDPEATDNTGEPRDEHCTCGHHRVMHATVA